MVRTTRLLWQGRRPEKGLNSGKWNYTPDIELYIEHEGQTHIALVEIKSVLHHPRYGFSKYIFDRMRQAARIYFATMLLLYVDENKTWYRIDYKTGQLTVFGTPTPASKSIDQAYRPLTVNAKKIYQHAYKQRFDRYLFTRLGNIIADSLEGAVRHLTSPTKTRGRRRYRRF